MQRRDEVVTASKLGKLDPSVIRAELETSLKNLKTDCIDIYYLHNPPEEPEKIEKLLAFLKNLSKRGRYEMSEYPSRAQM